MALVGARHQRKIGGGGFQPELPSLLEAIHVDGEEAFALLLYAGGVAHLKHFICDYMSFSSLHLVVNRSLVPRIGKGGEEVIRSAPITPRSRGPAGERAAALGEAPAPARRLMI